MGINEATIEKELNHLTEIKTKRNHGLMDYTPEDNCLDGAILVLKLLLKITTRNNFYANIGEW